MQITRALDYTLRALVYMAHSQKGTVFMRSDLSKVCLVPDSFLGKVLQNLVRAEILVSERGKNGGFHFAKDPKHISIYDVYVAVDGPLGMTNCLIDGKSCQYNGLCSVHNIWQDIQESVAEKLRAYTVYDLVNIDKTNNCSKGGNKCQQSI